MLISYNGEFKEVQVKGGCSVCSQQSGGTTVQLRRVTNADYALLDGRFVNFHKGIPVQVSDKDGLELASLTYEFKGKTYDKFTVM